MRDCDIYDENGQYWGRIRNNVIHDSTGIFGDYKGEIRGNDIYDGSGRFWGTISNDGRVYKGISPFGEYVGKIKEDGSMFSNEGYSGKLKYTSNDINTSNTSNGYSYSDDVGTSRGAYVNAKATENGIIGFIISGVICVILFAFGVGFIRVLLTFYLLAITIGGALDFKDDYKSNLKSGKSGLDGLIGEVLIFVLVVIPLWILIIFT